MKDIFVKNIQKLLNAFVMKNVLSFLMAVLCLPVLFTACKNEEPELPPQSETTFKLSVTAPEKTSATVEIVPSDPSATYYYSVMPKSEYETLADDKAVHEKDLAMFTQKAEQEGKSLEQIISYVVTTGQIVKKIENLTAGTEYRLYAYSLDNTLEAGKVYTADFTTLAETEAGISINVNSVSSSSASITFKPTRDDFTYYFSVVNKAVFDDQILSDSNLIKTDLDKFRSDAVNQNKFLNEYLDEVLVKGEHQRTLENLRPRTTFYVYAYGIDNMGNVATPVFKQEVTTQEPEKIQASFDISVSDISSSSVTLGVVPSSDNVRYYVDYMVKYVYDGEGGNVKVIEDNYYQNLALSEKIGGTDNPIEKIVEEMSNFGTSSHNVLRLMTETEYVAYAFAIDAWGNIISDIYTQEFKTTSIELSDLTIDMDVEYLPGKVKITVTPSDPDATYIFDFAYGSDIDRYDNDKDIINMILSFSFDIVSGTQVYEYERPFNEDKFYALAFGYSKETGPNTQVFKTAVYSDGPNE